MTVSNDQSGQDKREPKHTKEEYLLLLVTGIDRNEVAKEWGITEKGLMHWLKKWGIKDPAEEEIALAEYRERIVVRVRDSHGERSVSPDVQEAQEAQREAMQPAREPLNLWIRIPLLNVNQTFGEQLAKVEEEIDELSREVKGYRGRQLALSEALDVMQSLIGALYLDLAELMSPDQAAKKLKHFLVQTNREHVAKIQRYTVERGWKVIDAMSSPKQREENNDAC